MLVCWIALSVAVAPVVSAFAFELAAAEPAIHDVFPGSGKAIVHGVMTHHDDSDMPEMPDCHKAKSTTADCSCCDTKSKCPSDSACMWKCGKVLGAVMMPARVIAFGVAHEHPAEPDKPPGWLNQPPAPPPRI